MRHHVHHSFSVVPSYRTINHISLRKQAQPRRAKRQQRLGPTSRQFSLHPDNEDHSDPSSLVLRSG